MITIINETFSPRGFVQDQYFAAGQIIILHHQVEFAIGGQSFLNNLGDQTTLQADDPLFAFMEVGDTIQIVKNTAPQNSIRTITQKINDYTIVMNSNLNMGTGANGFVSLVVTSGFNLIIKRFLYSLNVSEKNTYLSIVSLYEKTFATNQQGAAITSNTLPYNNSLFNLVLFPYHKLVDSLINDIFIGYNNNTFFQFQGQNVGTVTLNVGTNSGQLAFYNAKGLTEPNTNSRKIFFHHNPVIPNEKGYENQNTMLINSKFRLSRVPGNNLKDINIVRSVIIDQFGYFGERGNGREATMTPKDIVLNGGAGFQFDTTTQMLNFKTGVQANGTTNFVYIVFQRWVEDNDFSDFDLNKIYQYNWGVTPIFAFPTNTITQLNLDETIITGQCLSISPTLPNVFEYTFQFNVVASRLSDIMGWKYGLCCYVVIETPSTCESHLLFKAKYSVPVTPPAQISLLSEAILPYDTEIPIFGVQTVYTLGSMFLWQEINLDLSAIVSQNAKLKSITARLRDMTDTFDLFKYTFDLQGHQIDTSGNPVFLLRQATQSGSVNNHPNSFFYAQAQAGGLTISVPIVHRIESWIPLQPNAGAYFNPSLPNNGQNYNFVNYSQANLKIEVVYDINNVDYQYLFTKRIRFGVGFNTTYPYNVTISSIIDGVYNLDMTPATTLYAGTPYILKLNIAPTEHCICVRGVFEDKSNVFTWGTWYPDASNYKPNNTYSNIFVNENANMFTFIPPIEGKLGLLAIFSKFALGKDNVVFKGVAVDVLPKETIYLDPPAVETDCCEVYEVEKNDFSTIMTTKDTALSLYKDGIFVATINNNLYGTFYPYDTIKGLQIITIDWEKVFSLHGYGSYQIKTIDFESDYFCLVEEAIHKLIIDLELNQKIGSLDFIANPVRFYYRLSGFISGDTTSVESEEVKFHNGNILQTKKSNERNYKVTIKKCKYRVYNELSSFCVFAKSWTISDYNERNVIAHRDLKVLPPTSLNPEWKYSTNFSILEFEVKRSTSLSSNKC